MTTKKGKCIVRCKCIIIKDVYCENCTKHEASINPFEHATDEQEVDQMDYDVQRVDKAD